MTGVYVGSPLIYTSGGNTYMHSLVFNSSGQGTTNTSNGYSGMQQNGSYYYSLTTGWPTNVSQWSYGLNASTGVYTCPVAGFYVMGYNGIHRGGSGIPAGYNTYGYCAFCKNGVLFAWAHWNMSTTNQWNTGGISSLFSCAANDTLALFINRSPTSVAPDSQTQNFGLYPDQHSCIWCFKVG